MFTGINPSPALYTTEHYTSSLGQAVCSVAEDFVVVVGVVPRVSGVGRMVVVVVGVSHGRLSTCF